MGEDGAKIEVERAGATLLARVRGSLTGPFAREAGDALAAAVRAGPRPGAVVVDLGGCEAVDSLGVAAIVAAAGGAPVTLVGAGPAVALLPLPPDVRLAPRRAALPRRGDPDPPAALRERRRHERAPAGGPAELRWHEPEGRRGTVVATVRDVSEGGMGLAGDRPCGAAVAGAGPARKRDGMEVRDPLILGRRWTPCRLVAHPDPEPGPAFGLEFRRLSAKARRRIRAIARGHEGPVVEIVEEEIRCAS